MTDDELSAIQARADAATPGPWEAGEPWQQAGIMPEKFGDGRCALCSYQGEPVKVGEMRINGRLMPAHLHRNPNPYGLDHRISNAAGGTVAGMVDYDDGGIYDPDDLAFIVAARTDVPRLLAEVAQLRVERDWLLAEADDDARGRYFAAKAGGR
jgi:hypothetical protein